MSIMIVGPSLNFIGGISTFCSGLISKLEEKNYDVDYFDTYSFRGRRTQVASSLNKNELCGLIKVFSGFWKKVSNTSIKKVILNTSSYWGFYEKSLLLILSKLYNKEVTLIVHGAEFKDFYMASNLKFFIRYLLKKSDKVLFVSEEHYNFFKQISPSINAYQFHAPVLIPAYYEDPGESSELQAIVSFTTNFEKIFFSISVLEKRKRVIELINDFMLKSTAIDCLIVAGGGPLQNEIEQLCKNLTNVLFVGPLFGELKGSVYQMSDIIICNSETESFGITFIEGMLTNNVVISPKTGVLRKFNADIEYIEYTNWLDNDLKLEKDYCSQIIMNSYQKALLYTWECSFKKFDKLLQQ